jgi:hypothetical protein
MTKIRPSWALRIALAGLIALAMSGAGTAEASGIDLVSVTRSVSLSITEQPISPGSPTNGGLGPLTNSSSAIGTFQSGFAESYRTGDGNTVRSVSTQRRAHREPSRSITNSSFPIIRLERRGGRVE